MHVQTQAVISYLEKYKEGYAVDALAGQLSAAGYAQEAIQEGVAAVFGDQRTKRSFWDFQQKREYANVQEKLIDFFVGLFGYWGIFIFANILTPMIGILYSLVGFVVLAVVLFNKRRYMFWGLMSNLVFALGLFLVIVSIF